MKQEKKKAKDKKNAPKFSAYIGLLSLLCVGLVSIVTLRTLGSLSPKDNPTAVIPTMPPLLPAVAPPVNPTMPSQAPLPTEEPEAATVFAKQEPFSLALPLSGDVLVPFSADKLLYSKTLGDWRTHLGLDLAADTGTAVMAAAEGSVTEAFFDPLMGHSIIIDHGEGKKTCYQNLASTEMVKPGQSVAKGEVIAAVGSSATAELLEDAHLHFVLLENGEAKNPLDFVK